MTRIEEIMRQEAEKNGAIPFDRFMELALYCPVFGYYEQPGMSPGTKGDFYTSVSVGQMFGKLLAQQFAAWLKSIPAAPRIIMECGAHDGRLAADVLESLAELDAKLFGETEYWILEPSETLRQRQKNTLASFADKVRWMDSWEKISGLGISGIIFSNELLDAMPVKRYGWDATHWHWFEWGVEVKDDHFAWQRLPGKALPEFQQPLAESLLEVLPDGFTTETCPAAVEWWKSAAQRLGGGKLLALDYGLTFPEFLAPQRAGGTLRAYHHHKLEKDVLANPGFQDITAHVNFDALIAAGESQGLLTDSFTTQERFLAGALQLLLADENRRANWTAKESRQFKTLTHPAMMGSSFRALIQSRNFAGE